MDLLDTLTCTGNTLVVKVKNSAENRRAVTSAQFQPCILVVHMNLDVHARCPAADIIILPINEDRHARSPDEKRE